MPFSSVLGASSVIKPGVCTSTTRPSVPYTGQLIYETDTNLVLAWNGSSWRAISNAIATNGGILQVVSTTKTDTFTTTSTSFTDITGLSVSITPTSATSKVLVLATYQDTMTLNQTAFVRLMRDTTAICVGDSAGNRQRATSIARGIADNELQTHSIVYLDSPATTSATTYKMQAASENASYTYYINRSNSDSDSSVRGRAASTITVFEVSA